MSIRALVSTILFWEPVQEAWPLDLLWVQVVLGITEILNSSTESISVYIMKEETARAVICC